MAFGLFVFSASGFVWYTASGMFVHAVVSYLLTGIMYTMYLSRYGQCLFPLFLDHPPLGGGGHFDHQGVDGAQDPRRHPPV